MIRAIIPPKNSQVLFIGGGRRVWILIAAAKNTQFNFSIILKWACRWWAILKGRYLVCFTQLINSMPCLVLISFRQHWLDCTSLL